jgi:heterodisulfide reductase subunit B
MFKSAEEDFNKKRVDFVTGGQYDEYGGVGLTAQEAARLSQNPDQLNQYAEAQRNKAIAERDRYLPLNQSGNMFINNPYYTYGNERVNQLSNENVRNMISKFLNESGYNNTMYRR